MNIGEMINKFDNETDGTLKSFNKMFKECPIQFEISPESIVDVKDIVGIGNETKRFIEVNGELKTHDFIKKPVHVIKNSSNGGKNVEYLVKKDGKGVFVCKTRDEIAKKLKIGYTKLNKMVKYQKVYNGYSVDVVKVEKKKYIPKYKFIITTEDKKPIEIIGIKDTAKYLGLSEATVYNRTSGRYTKKDVSIKKVKLNKNNKGQI